jgi:hypothetical protein
MFHRGPRVVNAVVEFVDPNSVVRIPPFTLRKPAFVNLPSRHEYAPPTLSVIPQLTLLGVLTS